MLNPDFVTDEDVLLKVAASFNRLVAKIGTFLGCILVVISFAVGFKVFNGFIYFPVTILLASFISLALIIGMCFSVFLKTRFAGGTLLVVCSTFIFFLVWWWSFAIVWALAGKIWLIIGLCGLGVGVIPVAIIVCGIYNEWGTIIQMIVMIAAIWGLRFISVFVLTKSRLKTTTVDALRTPVKG
jgi:hypothetical protein